MLPKSNGKLIRFASLGRPDDGGMIFLKILDDSLASVGLAKDSQVVFEASETVYRIPDDLDEERLSVWFVGAASCDLLIGFAYENFGAVSVRLPGGEVCSLKFKGARLENQARFAGYIRAKLVPFEVEICPDQKDGEIAAVCDGCSKEIKGSRQFLSAQGWRLKRNETLCVTCW